MTLVTCGHVLKVKQFYGVFNVRPLINLKMSKYQHFIHAFNFMTDCGCLKEKEKKAIRIYYTFGYPLFK